MNIHEPQARHGLLVAELASAAFLETSSDIAIDGELTMHLKTALNEIEHKLKPIPSERLDQIISRLLLHFTRLQGDEQQRLKSCYLMLLKAYPEDLLCAAYHHLLMHYDKKQMPSPAEFFAFMEPEMKRRETIRRKLSYWSSQLARENV